MTKRLPPENLSERPVSPGAELDPLHSSFATRLGVETDSDSEVEPRAGLRESDSLPVLAIAWAELPPSVPEIAEPPCVVLARDPDPLAHNREFIGIGATPLDAEYYELEHFQKPNPHDVALFVAGIKPFPKGGSARMVRVKDCPSPIIDRYFVAPADLDANLIFQALYEALSGAGPGLYGASFFTTCYQLPDVFGILHELCRRPSIHLVASTSMAVHASMDFTRSLRTASRSVCLALESKKSSATQVSGARTFKTETRCLPRKVVHRRGGAPHPFFWISQDASLDKEARRIESEPESGKEFVNEHDVPVVVGLRGITWPDYGASIALMPLWPREKYTPAGQEQLTFVFVPDPNGAFRSVSVRESAAGRGPEERSWKALSQRAWSERYFPECVNATWTLIRAALARPGAYPGIWPSS